MLPINLEEFFPEEKLQEMNEKEIKILEAAIEIFAEKGFVSTSTNEIAKKANVAEGTIFRYFKTKKDLLKSIIKPTLVKTIAPFEMDRFSKAVFHLEHETFEDFLDALIKNRMDFAKKNKAVVKIIIQEMPFQEDMQEELKRLFKDKMYPRVATVLQSFIEKGQIKEFPIPTVLRLIISTAIGLVISSILLENTPFWNEEQETRRTIEYIKAGLEPGNR